jgi:transposase
VPKRQRVSKRSLEIQGARRRWLCCQSVAINRLTQRLGVQEQIPWAAPYSRVTYRLEFRLCALCQIMTQKAAAAILQMPASTLSELLHRIIARVREGHAIRGLTTLGVDEISYCKGRKFATIVYDLKRARVVWIGKGKGRETIDQFFREALSSGQRARVRWASCDMSRTYIEAIKAHCPNATLVIDRFHVVKALNEALDEVRKEQWRELGKDERKAIKGLRWLLARHSRNRTPEHTRMSHAPGSLAPASPTSFRSCRSPCPG